MRDMTECDNCGAKVTEQTLIPLHEVKHLFLRINPGNEIPAGECRECGALAYIVKPEK